jgi:hypothetical protein
MSIMIGHFATVRIPTTANTPRDEAANATLTEETNSSVMAAEKARLL